jgi:predicted aspartyl protease
MELSCVQAQTTVWVFTWTGAAPTQVRFYVREGVDGTLLISKTLTGNPTQIVYSAGAQTITVTLASADTAAVTAGTWRYDLQVTTAAGVTIPYRGKFILAGLD